MTKALIQRRGTGRTISAGGMAVEYLATSDLSDDAIGIYLCAFGRIAYSTTRPRALDAVFAASTRYSRTLPSDRDEGS